MLEPGNYWRPYWSFSFRLDTPFWTLSRLLQTLKVSDRCAWEGCARTSLPRLNSSEYVSMGCSSAFCLQEIWKTTVFRWWKSSKQAYLVKLLFHSHTDVLIDKTQGSLIFSILISVLRTRRSESTHLIFTKLPLLPHLVILNNSLFPLFHERSLDIPDSEELTLGTLILCFCIPLWHTDLQEERKRTRWTLSISAGNPERQ